MCSPTLWSNWEIRLPCIPALIVDRCVVVDVWSSTPTLSPCRKRARSDVLVMTVATQMVLAASICAQLQNAQVCVSSLCFVCLFLKFALFSTRFFSIYVLAQSHTLLRTIWTLIGVPTLCDRNNRQTQIDAPSQSSREIQLLHHIWSSCRRRQNYDRTADRYTRDWR
jgi:hypothetical protein